MTSVSERPEPVWLRVGEVASELGVSANTVYLWENDKVTPRGKSRSALVGVREFGAREAKELVELAREKLATTPRARKRRA